MIKVDIDDINKYEKNSNLLASLPGNIGKKKTGYLFKIDSGEKIHHFYVKLMTEMNKWIYSIEKSKIHQNQI